MNATDELKELYNKIEYNIEKDINKLEELYFIVNDCNLYYTTVEEYLKENEEYQIERVLEHIEIIKRIKMNISYNPERFEEQKNRYQSLYQDYFSEEEFFKLFQTV